METLSNFIATERERFSNRHNNIFAFAFSQITRYREFLEIIFVRYRDASDKFIENSKQLQTTLIERTGTMTTEQLRLFEEGRRLTTILHLEIESFYLFAKIFLDKTARAVEFYFGQSQGLSLDSHDDLAKNLQKYIAAKGLAALADETKDLIEKLKSDISDYRDKEIAHEKSPRTMKGTIFSNGTKTTRIASTKLYPKEKDMQVESREIEEVISLIDKYLGEMIGYIRVNSDKTNLELVDARA